jgi:3-methyl-2-oxobutanoate hydroxymethyltransferase
MKRNGEKIAMLTAYDAPQARAQQQAGIDVILVGDSVGVNILGYSSEREVTLADMAHHTRAVRRGAPDTFIIADMPFATYDSPEQAVASAKFLQQAGADAVKFEGAHPELVQVLATSGIPVCGHLGYEPQHCERRVHGKTFDEAAHIFADARALDEAGAFMLVIELAPAELAAAVTKAIKAATIGIGAGPATDGQVLVFPDVLGYIEKNFRHNRRYAEVGAAMREAAAAYLLDVRAKDFPTMANASSMPAEVFTQFEAEILEKQG